MAHGVSSDRDARRPWRTALRIAVAVVLLTAGVTVAAPAVGAGAADPDWDPRLGNLPAEVAHLRGLRFEHAVPVRFLREAEFVKQRGVDPGKFSADARQGLSQATRMFRALGLLAGPVHLGEAVKTARRSGVLAYYDPEREEIVVRGRAKRLDVPQKVVLAHELTHVLQDQHFDLDRLRKRAKNSPGQSTDAYRAVIEGDARRIEGKYRASLSASERAEYSDWQRATAKRAGEQTSDVPEVVTLAMTAPYALGTPAMKVVAAGGGNRAVDEVFRHGVFTQRLFLDPTVSITEPAPKPLAAPKLGPRERAVGTPSVVGAFDLYTLLATHMDPVAALEAASGWANGRSRLVRDGSATCVRIALTARDRAATDRLAKALSTWAVGMPSGQAELGRRGKVLTVRACDPGPDAGVASPDPALQQAEYVLALHNSFEQGLAQQARASGLPMRYVRCLALELLRSPEMTVLLALPRDQVSADQMKSAVTASAPGVRKLCGL